MERVFSLLRLGCVFIANLVLDCPHGGADLLCVLFPPFLTSYVLLLQSNVFRFLDGYTLVSVIHTCTTFRALADQRECVPTFPHLPLFFSLLSSPPPPLLLFSSPFIVCFHFDSVLISYRPLPPVLSSRHLSDSFPPFVPPCCSPLPSDML